MSIEIGDLVEMVDSQFLANTPVSFGDEIYVPVNTKMIVVSKKAQEYKIL